ncbi:MAG: Uma2 family endonuclease [Acidobacteriota bacterium]|nr:Uma2 family endonuclease [Acidobacteriota bacterium]
MTTQTLSYYEIVTHLPANTVVIFHDVGWQEYEELLSQIGEARGQRISYTNGTLQVMTLSPEHEKYAEFIKRLVSHLSFRLRINILFFGSMTMKRHGSKGTEPDACFYVQSAGLIGNRVQLDFASDPPPDIAVEIDVHHESISKFPIYAALLVPEIWHYDGQQLTIHYLAPDSYVAATKSRALPILNDQILTDLLIRLREEGEFQTILAFDEWLQTQAGDGGQGTGAG